MPHEYPTGTYINCVMVTGEGHGKSFSRSPADAYGFKFMKRQAIAPTFLPPEEMPMSIETETIHYEPFFEFWTRDGFVRCFIPVNYSSRSEKTSILQVADALRIAGIEYV